MKRTILKKLTVCLCLCAVLSGALTVPAGAASFQDVPSNHWQAPPSTAARLRDGFRARPPIPSAWASP